MLRFFILSLAGSACTMSEYNKLKSMLLDMQPKLMKTGQQSQQRDMEEKRALVDTMFKYLDVNQDSRLVSDELEKVSLELKCLDQFLTRTVRIMYLFRILHHELLIVIDSKVI